MPRELTPSFCTPLTLAECLAQLDEHWIGDVPSLLRAVPVLEHRGAQDLRRWKPT